MNGEGIALSALVRKRPELAGEIRMLEDQLEQLRSNILHMDATIQIIQPGYHTDGHLQKPLVRVRQWWWDEASLVGGGHGGSGWFL